VRTVLLHVNVQVPDDDGRDAGQIAESVAAAIEVGSDAPELDGLEVAVVLAEEV